MTAHELETAADEALMALAKSGRLDAFEALARRYEQPLFRFARWMIGDAAEAEDMVQDTLWRTYRSLTRFREGAPVRPWIYRIAANRCRDHLRSVRRRPLDPLDERPIVDPSADPHARAVAGEQAECLKAAVDALPERHRAVFLLARYEGLPYEEVAAALRIPVGTVKSRMNKAVKLLCKRLEEEDG